MVLEMLRAILREHWWPPAPTKLHYSYVAGRLMSDVATCHPGCSVAERTSLGDRWVYPFIDDPVVREEQFHSYRDRMASYLGRKLSGIRNRRRN